MQVGYMTKLLGSRMWRIPTAAAATAVVVHLTGIAVGAGQPSASGSQGPAPAGTVVVGSGNILLIQEDVEKSIGFYENLLKLTVQPLAKPGPRPYSSSPALLNMVGMPGAQLRFILTRVPGSNMQVELEEFKDIERKAVRPRPQDPGGVTLILLV